MFSSVLVKKWRVNFTVISNIAYARKKRIFLLKVSLKLSKVLHLRKDMNYFQINVKAYGLIDTIDQTVMIFYQQIEEIRLTVTE